MFGRILSLLGTGRTQILYALSIFLSAFLLFQVQPMVAHYLLPFFGGSVSVWGTSLVFFTVTLFLGYLYAYFLSRLPLYTQALIHLSLLGVGAVFVLGFLVATGSVYPSLDWVFDARVPTVQVLLALTACIGIPYLILSATGPLLQHWYASETHQEPYHLYALSNLGSFLALGTYPFVIEPLFGLYVQQITWSMGFLVCAGLLATVAYVQIRSGRRSAPQTAPTVVPTSQLWMWLGLSALPAALLVATTARITQVLAPVPFLWIVPLALYLLSFILAFRGWGQGGLTPFLVVLSAFASYFYLDYSFGTVLFQVLSNTAFFFLSALYCHALLYRMRGSKYSSSFYYVWLALGGALGTIAATMIAPLVFVNFTEFVIGIEALAVLAVVSFPAMTYIKEAYEKQVIILKSTALVSIIILFATFYIAEERTSLFKDRNFYGAVDVYEMDEVRYLYNGTTLHGMQYQDAALEREATTYFVPSSGVGRALVYTKEQQSSVRVGIIGLGAGTLASYCDFGDTFVFYELDPRIGDIATDYFSFLDSCPNAELRYGDGRVLLEDEREKGELGAYDVMVVDAFSDDSIPVHLLTKEAVELYIEHLRTPESIIAIHTSNRYFNLSPVVRRIASELGLFTRVIYNDPEDGMNSASEWVLLSRDATTFNDEQFAAFGSVSENSRTPLWTDDYANVLAALDWNVLLTWLK